MRFPADQEPSAAVVTTMGAGSGPVAGRYCRSNLRAADPRLPRIADAVVVGVVVDVAAQACRTGQPEIVVDAVIAAVQLDAGNHGGTERRA